MRLPVPEISFRRRIGRQITHCNPLLLSFRSLPYPDDPHRVLFETTSQMIDPSRWMATQAIIFLPTLIGNTRQYMMKGVPSFL